MNKIKSFINKHYAGLSVIAICTLTFIFIAIINGFVFIINDDKTINNILSGTFTGNPNNEATYISQIVCYPLMLLYKLIPGVPFYGLFLILTMYTCSITIGLSIIKTDSQKNYFKSLLFFGIIFLGLLVYHISNLQYTVVAIFPILAIIALITKKRDNTSLAFKIFYFLYITFLMIISCAIRYHIFIIGMPFVGLAVLIKLLKNRQNKFFTLQFVLVITAAIFALGINTITNNLILQQDEEYQSYIEYNQVRSDLFDTYGFPSYNEARELYDELGIDQETLKLISSHYMLDIKEANLYNLKQIRDYQIEHHNKTSKALYAGITIFTHLFTSNFVEFLTLVVISIYAIASFKKKTKIDTFFFYSLFVGAFLMAFMIAFLLKFPPRIASSILLCCILSVVSHRLCYAPLEDLHLDKVFIVLACIIIPVNVFYTSAYMVYNKNNNGYKEMLESIITNDDDFIYYSEDYVVTYQTEYALREPYRLTNYYYSTWNTMSPYAKTTINNLGYDDIDDMFAHCNTLKIVLLRHSTMELLEYYFNKNYGRHLYVSQMIGSYYFDQELYICEVI